MYPPGVSDVVVNPDNMGWGFQPGDLLKVGKYAIHGVIWVIWVDDRVRRKPWLRQQRACLAATSPSHASVRGGWKKGPNMTQFFPIPSNSKVPSSAETPNNPKHACTFRTRGRLAGKPHTTKFGRSSQDTPSSQGPGTCEKSGRAEALRAPAIQTLLVTPETHPSDSPKPTPKKVRGRIAKFGRKTCQRLGHPGTKAQIGAAALQSFWQDRLQCCDFVLSS